MTRYTPADMDDGLHPQVLARVSFRTVLISIVVLWACYFLLTTVRGSIVGLELQFDLLWRRAVVTLAGVAITLMLWLLLRQFDARPLWIKVCTGIVFALPAALSVATINQMIFQPIQGAIAEKMARERGVDIRRDQAGNIFIEVPTDPDAIPANDAATSPREVLLSPASAQGWDRWRMIVDIAIGRYFLLLAWSSLYFALLAVSQTQLAERREAAFRRQAKEAELRSLRYQVNPHFLFNSLNSLSALVMTGKVDRAESMIQTLSNFYRRSLADETSSDVDLADEFALQRHYLAIEEIRFPERLMTDIDLPEELATACVPGMILQPLVENSVKYAVAPVSRPVTIRVAAQRDGDSLIVTVSDDGPGTQNATRAGTPGGFGIGLANVRDRLLARFGEAASVEAGPTNDGWQTILRMPLVIRELERK
ncbi:MAG: histidine kinase [Pontixanthobacter sp.]